MYGSVISRYEIEMPALTIALALCLVFLATESNAACECHCVGGEMQPICETPGETPPACPPTICTLPPYSGAPSSTPPTPPVGIATCAPEQVEDPQTHKFEWRTICQ